MKITTDQKPLEAALALVKKAVPKNGGAACRAVKIDAQDGGGVLTVTAGDRDLSICATVPAAVHEPGVAAVAHDELADAAKGKGSIDLIVDCADTLRAVNGLTTDIPLVDLEHLPRIPDGFGEPMPLDLAAIRGVIPAASKDGMRPLLTAVLFDGVNVVATDSYRLYVCDTPVTEYPKMLIPGDALAKVLASKPTEATIALDDNGNARITTPAATFTIRLLEGDFPSWKQLIPSTHPGIITLLRPRLDEVLGALAAYANKHTQSPTVRISAGSPVVMSVTAQADRVGAKKGKSGEVPGSSPMDIAFNPDFLLELFKGVDGCTLEVVDALKPALLRVTDDEGRLFRRLIMPVRVS